MTDMTELVEITHPEIPGGDHYRPRAAVPHYEASGWHVKDGAEPVEIAAGEIAVVDLTKTDPAGSKPDAAKTKEN